MKNKVLTIKLVVLISILLCVGGCKKNDSAKNQEVAGTTVEKEITNFDDENKGNEQSGENTEIATGETDSKTTEIVEIETTVASEENVTAEINTTEKSTEETTTKKQETTTKKQETTTKKPNNNESVTQQLTTGGSTGNNSNNNQQGSNDKGIKEYVESILAKIIKPSMSQLEKAVVIHDYITYNVDYDYSNYLAGTIPSASHTALGAFKYGKAVCDGYAYAFYELAKGAGLDVKVISGGADNGSGKGYEGHAWNQIKIDGKWYNLDVTWDDPTYEGKDPDDHTDNGYAYFLISDEMMYKDHRPNNAEIKCKEAISAKLLAKAIVECSTSNDSIYISSGSEIKNKVSEAINKGLEEFTIYMDHIMDDDWDVFDRTFKDAKSPYRVTRIQPSKNGIVKYTVEKMENTYCVSSSSDIKTIIDKNKNKISELRFWYYNDSLTDDNARGFVNAELAKTGYNLRCNTATSAENNCVEITVSEDDSVVILKDLTEIIAFINNNSREVTMSKTIMYIGKEVSDEEFFKALYDGMIPNGFEMGVDFDKYNGVTKIKFYAPRDVLYVESSEQIVDIIKTKGISSLKGNPPVLYIGNVDASSVVQQVVLDIALKAEIYMDISYNLYHGYLTIYCENVREKIYISSDMEGLKQDILSVQNSGNISGYEFWYVDKTGNFNGMYESVEALVKATGCNVNVYMSWYEEDGYHKIILY